MGAQNIMSVIPGLLHLSSGGEEARVAVANNTKFAMLALIFIVLSVGFASIWFLQKEAEEIIETPTPQIKEAAKSKKKTTKMVKTNTAKKSDNDVITGNSVAKKSKADTNTKTLGPEQSEASSKNKSTEKKAEDVEEEEWIDVPINQSPSTLVGKKSVAFAMDMVEPAPPPVVAMAPPRDKSKKKQKETPEQKQARLERKAAAKRQKEQEELERKNAFEERLKASEVAAILQAQENSEQDNEKHSTSIALGVVMEATGLFGQRKVRIAASKHSRSYWRSARPSKLR